jgi:hypothetical protein
MLSTSVSLEEMRFLGPNHPLNQKAFKFSIGDLHDFDSLHELVLKESHETNCNRWKKEKENSRRQHGNRPLTIAFTSGLVWPNIQANERAIIAMKVQNNASSFLTPKFSKKRNKNPSTPVMRTPSHNGMYPFDRIRKAIALPITCWTSAPIIATSVMIQRNVRAHTGYSSRQSSAR